MKNATLVVMAAGIGSRFGGGIKQLEPMGPSGEIIMDYSIHDAKEAGFNKVVFIIRKDLEKDFKEIIGNRIEKVIDVEYAFQEMDNLPEGFSVPEGRKKPWGTGQAILSCKGIVKEPFVVINADDYYGKTGFKKVYNHLVNAKSKAENGVYDMCMAGFILGNTLSENGTVTRGICQSDEEGYLTTVVETSGLKLNEQGVVEHDDNGTDMDITAESLVSMNMWGFTPDFIDELDKGFTEFLKTVPEGDVKKEYLLPSVVDSLIQSKNATVKILPTEDKWFGVTYKEDKEAVVNAFKELIANGVYKEELWG
ncbi:MAG: nucleotidyltransferase [Lachnospiraceae bacterium]|nr:nucleotidyltransferase [Lachnospiraceae bacterium]